MPSLILRKYRSSEDVELNIDNVEGLSVKELRENVASRLEIPLEELKLVFGGRILKAGKTVVDYKVTAGCTIYVLVVKQKRSAPKENYSNTATPGVGSLMNNRRVLALIGRVLGNPGILQDMAQGIGMAAGSAAMMQVLGNQQLLDSLSDPDNIQEYIRENPDMAAMMEQVIRQFLGSGASGEEEQVVDLLESHLEEEMAQAESGGEAQRTLAQEQMFEHSQALQAHNQQQRLGDTSSGPSSLHETSFNPTTSQQYGSISRVSRQNSGTITQDQLASALANAMGSSSPHTNSSPMASLNHSQLHSSSQPSSLPSAPPPSYSATFQPAANRHRPISAATLQQALATVSPSGSPANDHQSTGRYQMQLEQLQLMGITDETACLHALAATEGDLQAALDILYSQ